MRVVRPDRLRLGGPAHEPERRRDGEARRRRSAARGPGDLPGRVPERGDPEPGEHRERRRQLDVVVRVEVAAADHAEGRRREPEAREERCPSPAERGEEGDERERLRRGRQREPKEVQPPWERARDERVALAAVGEDRVPPVAKRRGRHRAERDGHCRRRRQDPRRPEPAAPARPDEVGDRGYARVEGRLLHHEGAASEEARGDEPFGAAVPRVRDEREQREGRRQRREQLAGECERLDERRGPRGRKEQRCGRGGYPPAQP